MDMSPQRVRAAEFRVVRKGLDPDEVRSFLDEVADELEQAQNQTTAMEARARAALARLQEAEAGAAATTAGDRDDAEAGISADQADAISKTLLLAQRTADATVAEATAEAERVLAAAREEADATIESTRELSSKLVSDAREEARRAGESQRLEIASEVDALVARRAFLLDDVEHLEQFVADQRARLRDAAAELTAVAERVPAGLGSVHPPVVSAADEPHEPAIGARPPADDVATHPDVVVPGVPQDVHGSDDERSTDHDVQWSSDDRAPDGATDSASDGASSEADDVTTGETTGAAAVGDDTPASGAPSDPSDSGGFSFRFEDD
jgi:DivIVA domain-containing protein